MKRVLATLAVGLALVGSWCDRSNAPAPAPAASIAPSSTAPSVSVAPPETVPSNGVALRSLPPEAAQTLTLIKAGGPFPYPKDGTTFLNLERRLPPRPRGYYHEYTVPTPGERTRGARRIIAGEGPARDVTRSGEYYYTDDHYGSFRRVFE